MQAELQSQQRRSGVLSALAGFVLWGCFPLYWKQLQAISAWEAIAHRVVWSFVFLVPVVWRQGRGRELWLLLKDGRQASRALAAGVLLAGNWLIYVWAVHHGHVIESSLGYFLVPLVNAGLGRLIFREEIRPAQKLALGLAAIGVGLLLFRLGHFPWIALGLAGTWSTYGVLKKQSTAGPILGLTAETALLFLPAAAMLLVWFGRGEGGLGHADPLSQILILLSGVVTAVPLLLFARGAQSIRMVTLGLLQFVTPTVQFLIGAFVYHEPFEGARLQAYALIWSALVVYSADAVWQERHRAGLAPAK